MASKNLKIETPENGVVTVNIELTATPSMVKQRVRMMVKAHERDIELFDGDKKLDDGCTLVSQGVTGDVPLKMTIRKQEEKAVVEVEADEGLMGAESEEPPALPESLEGELTDDQQDAQNKAKEQAQDALEDGDLGKAVASLTEAVMVGAPSAMLLAKRAEVLLKAKRPLAAVRDADAAIAKNPDSVKALRIRGKAHRVLGHYEEARTDLARAQATDYDDAAADMLKYVTDRMKKMKEAAAQ
mmetsp:Transcript_53464/g.117351  ORF Transcript_53464/g.117351 Transcript_53464/m.117351 type:complete len:242 (-) Transcript_53464:136-861(-)|eukprot:CAMPEP_0204275162 /NCGR_PEP_ID=MMETSP0468-20130131/25596_1 /ASSEMBLY_ACC=CAM_ASM_000383 /TAXON_ID=2969 /ORGANISM="Oxyrrhis marina" /LENGTH=241 /DNA_ID=CAMNT_0051251457 /DNA_START=42 /DNA_END=767 /DNA_ORIENTATION=-